MREGDLVSLAQKTGFSQAALLDVTTLTPLDTVRDMCAADRCRMYGHCWTCPPACGSIEENANEIMRYHTGLVVQTTRVLEDAFDYEGMESSGQAHQELFRLFRDQLHNL